MNSSPDPDLVKITEVFLVPCSFLVAALGTADTNPHRAGVSLIGLVVSLMWCVCSQEALAERPGGGHQAENASHSRRIQIMAWLPIFFAGCWAVSVVVHILLWAQPLGQ